MNSICSKTMRNVLMCSACLVVALIGTATAEPISTTFQQGQGGYSGTADTTLMQAQPDVTDMGPYRKLRVVGFYVDSKARDQCDQSLVRFDDIFGGSTGQVPLGSTIISATLAVQTIDGSAGDAADIYGIHQLLQGFTEDSNWGNSYGSNGVQRDGTEALAAASDTEAGPIADDSWVDLDVTSDVQAWSSGATNYGWVLVENDPGAATDLWQINSSEAATVSDRPKLSITYVPEPGTLALLTSGLVGLLCYAWRKRR